MTEEIDYRPALGEVAAIPAPHGGYGACQVVEVWPGGMMVAALDWFGAQPPSPEQLAGAGVLVQTHDPLTRPALVLVPEAEATPPFLSWLGRLPVPADIPDSGRVQGGWGGLLHAMWQERRFAHELPEAARTAFLATRRGPRGLVEVDFGAGPAVFPHPPELWKDVAADLRFPPTGPVPWSTLDALPVLREFHWSGPDRGLSAALAAHPIIRKLYWENPPAEVDLSATYLTGLSLVDFSGSLRLPRGLDSLAIRLRGDQRPIDITAVDRGRWISLTIAATDPVIPAGLAELAYLSLAIGGTLRAGILRASPELASLNVWWKGPPGDIEDAAVLGELPRLRSIRLHQAYGLDPATLPAPDAWPALRRLDVNGLRKSAATALTKAYRGSPVTLDLHGAKTDAWLMANLTNPFRDWADDHPRAATVACKAYGSALRAIDKLPPDEPARTDATRAVLRALVETVNGLYLRYPGFVDTIRREETAEVVIGLGERAGYSGDLADAWFNQWREF